MEPSMSEHNRRTALPGWMQAESASINSELLRLKRRRSFIGKTIEQMKQALADGLLTEVYASRDGLLQRLNPRIKLIAALLLLLLISLSRSIPLMLGLWACTVLFMYLSRLPVLSLQKQIWGFVPLVTALIYIPAMFNIVMAGTPLLIIHQSTQPSTWLGIHIPAAIYITRQGFKGAVFLVSRVGLSLSTCALLTMTTPVARLLKSLQIIGVPSTFVMIIEMSYRYLVQLLTISIEMFEARSLRTVGVMSKATRRAQLGTSIAALFAKSMTTADEVYLAMIARGYTGHAVSAAGKEN
jgi:cobalt/nickel transport system permease protein